MVPLWADLTEERKQAIRNMAKIIDDDASTNEEVDAAIGTLLDAMKEPAKFREFI